MNDRAHLGVVAQSHMLQHAHGHKCVVAPGYVPVIVFKELDSAVQSFLPRSLAGKIDCSVRKIHALSVHPLMPCHVESQSTPPAAGLDHVFAGRELEFAADMV